MDDTRPVPCQRTPGTNPGSRLSPLRSHPDSRLRRLPRRLRDFSVSFTTRHPGSTRNTNQEGPAVNNVTTSVESATNPNCATPPPARSPSPSTAQTPTSSGSPSSPGDAPPKPSPNTSTKAAKSQSKVPYESASGSPTTAPWRYDVKVHARRVDFFAKPRQADDLEPAGVVS